MHGCGCGPAQALAVIPAMSQSRPHVFTGDLALESCENRQLAGHRATGWCGQAQRLEQRYELDAQVLEILRGSSHHRVISFWTHLPPSGLHQ
jgi:hypothetical protein